jgi:hypothetical protein
MYDPHSPSGAGAGFGTGGLPMSSLHSSALAHSSMVGGASEGASTMAIKPEDTGAPPSPYAGSSSSSGGAGGAASGGIQFQEVTLRMTLEPYVTSAAEMDYLIKWLKTLFYVLVDRTISTSDLEHSLFVGSISLPALLAIHRSRCIEGKPRLGQVHAAIDAYLKNLGLQLAQRGPLPPPPPPVQVAHTVVTGSPPPDSTTDISGSSGSSGSTGSGGSSGSRGSGDSHGDNSSSPEMDQAEHASVADGLLLSSLSSVRPLGPGAVPPAPAPTPTAASSGPRAPGDGPAVSLPDIENAIRSQAVFSQLPEHLRAYLTEVHSASDAVKPSSSAFTAPAPGAASAAEGKFTSLAAQADPARYYAELHAASFAQQQAKALATAQAQAKALAESYRCPVSSMKRDINGSFVGGAGLGGVTGAGPPSRPDGTDLGSFAIGKGMSSAVLQLSVPY